MAWSSISRDDFRYPSIICPIGVVRSIRKSASSYTSLPFSNQIASALPQRNPRSSSFHQIAKPPRPPGPRLHNQTSKKNSSTRVRETHPEIS